MAKYCSNCGSQLGDFDTVCTNCGHTLSEGKRGKKDDLAPVVSPWAYVGYSLLFSLGIIGVILCIVFAVNHSNPNIKNYARGNLIIIGIVLVLIIIIIAAFGPLYLELIEDLLSGMETGSTF